MIDYRGPVVPSRRHRRFLDGAGGWTAGWSVGLVASWFGLAHLLGGTGVLVPGACAVTLVSGLPAFVVFRLATFRMGGSAGGVAFALAAVTCPAVAYALTMVTIASFHGC